MALAMGITYWWKGSIVLHVHVMKVSALILQCMLVSSVGISNTCGSAFIRVFEGRIAIMTDAKNIFQ